MSASNYTVRQEKFEGPLSLLLDLIEKEKLSVNEIALAEVTDEFIAYFKDLEQKGESDPEILAEFLVIASQLLLIKSKSLLPNLAFTSEEEASVAELEERLREYQRLKEAAAELGELARGGQKSFSREAYAGREAVFAPPKKFKLSMLETAFAALLEAVPKAVKLAEEKIKKIVSLEEKIRELRGMLSERVERAFSEIVSGAKEKVDVIVSFLALLELAKQKLVSVEQNELFSDIKIKKRNTE